MSQDLINKDKEEEVAASTNDSIFPRELLNEDDIFINQTDHEDVDRLEWFL